MTRMRSSPAAAALTVLASAVLSACGGGSGATASAGAPSALAQQSVKELNGCGNGKGNRETGLQGQVPAALRAAGFKGFNCNLDLVGQFEGEGGNWSSATFSDRGGHKCLYYATATNRPGRQNPGVPVIDITDPKAMQRTTSLTTPAMLDPWESLRAHDPRQILIADNGQNGGGGAEVDIYDISADCRLPQLMASVPVGTGTDGGITTAQTPVGHEGNIAPDGLTYWIGDLRSARYHAVDITNTSRPKMIASWAMSEVPNVGTVHGLSISNDGNRAYAVALGAPAAGEVGNPSAPARNGFVILDTSEVQQRKPNAQIRLISSTLYKDGSVAQHTIPAMIEGKQYLIMVDEGGSGGITNTATVRAACNAGLPPFPTARIYDISDEKHPVEVSKLTLEIHDPKNCDQVLPDIEGLNIFTYGSHYCSIDNRDNATALACSYFNSGIRVFDIRRPERPREIAYFNPPSASAKPGSSHAVFNQWRAGGPDWCASRLDFDYAKRQLVTMCQDNGGLVLQFAHGTWPFPDSTPSKSQN